MPTLFLLAEARVVKSKVLTLVRPIKQYTTTFFVSPLKQELKKGMPIGLVPSIQKASEMRVLLYKTFMLWGFV